MILKAEGIVLKSYDLRETSKIAVFFTKEYGKVAGVLKGIRKDHKKFGSYVDRFSINDIVYYEYRNSDLHLISHCDLKQYFFSIRHDYKKNLAANYILELVDHIMPVEEKNLKIYELMLSFLEGLDAVNDIDKLIFIFQIKTLGLSGFKPHLDSCVKCGKKIQAKVRFNSQLGGLMCSHCPSNSAGSLMISQGTIATLLYIEQNNWQKNLRLGLTSVVKKELKYILNHFLVYHLEKQLKSSKYIQGVLST